MNRKISDTLSQIQLLAQLQQQKMANPDTFISQNNKLSESLRRWKQKKPRLLDTDSDDMVERTHGIMGIWLLRTEIITLPHFSEIYFAEVRSLQPM